MNRRTSVLNSQNAYPEKPDVFEPLCKTTSNAASRRGSVLVAVLAIIVFITFMITRFMHEAMEDLEYRAIFNEPADVRSYAYSMLEVALATIQEVALIDDGKLYAGEQGWNHPIEYAEIAVPNGWQVQIEIRDEGGKLPINTMDESLLNRLLEERLDFDFSAARELSSTLLDWIDEDNDRRLNGAESEDYLRNNPPYRAANRYPLGESPAAISRTCDIDPSSMASESRWSMRWCL